MTVPSPMPWSPSVIVIQGWSGVAIHSAVASTAKVWAMAPVSGIKAEEGFAARTSVICSAKVWAMISWPISLGWNPSEFIRPEPEPKAALMSASRMAWAAARLRRWLLKVKTREDCQERGPMAGGMVPTMGMAP